MRRMSLKKIFHQKRIWAWAVVLLAAILVSTGCGSGASEKENPVGSSMEESEKESPIGSDVEATEKESPIEGGVDATDNSTEETAERSTTELRLLINDEEISVDWEENEAVAALSELAAKEPVEISMSMYGGFEQVGKIGADLPAADER